MMELRDITREQALLKSYKAVFVDSQKTELLRPYPEKKRRFPVFAERVFAAAAGATPVSLIDYRMRERLEDESPGRIFILERTDNTADTTRTRLFWVWVSPALAGQMASTTPSQLGVSAHVLFHPFGTLNEYPSYWTGGIDPLKIPNYLELGARYLCKEKATVAQHFCAVRASDGRPGSDSFAAKKCPLVVMVVVPVSSSASFTSLGNPNELQDALEQIARRCCEGFRSQLLPTSVIRIERVAVSGYSRSGAVLQTLLANAGGQSPFMQKLKEVYAFDVMLDEKASGNKKALSKKEGYDLFWSRLKTWQGGDVDRRIRLYSAEPATVASIYAELTERLKRYGGGFHRAAVPFSGFNGKDTADGKGKHTGLSDGFEIYSTDNSRSLVVLPSGNALVYLSSEKLVNPGGFEPGGEYEPGLEGHSWFVSRLQSHALFHSGF